MSSFILSNKDTIIPRMSQQQRETPPSRRRFSAEFKADAVRLITDHGYTHKAAADAIGISDSTLSGWARAARIDPPPCAGDASVEDLQAEVKRLRKQLARAEMEREILKKATQYFAKEPT
jgi:transposase